jgi:CubicO group peptidase (beta-lactamase class C family)
MALAIIKNGDVIIKKEYGFSDVSENEIVNSETGFNIGSISKMFTAWGIMKLVEDQKLNLDAPASKYLSELEITI